jgi:O-antigen/teichoic acid export membrane protein
VIRFFDHYEGYIKNSSWIIGGRVFDIGIAFIVTVIVARYLGPNKFGVLSYAISLMSLFATAGHVGLSGIVVREVVKYPDHNAEILGTTVGVKLFGYFVGFLLLILTFFISGKRGGGEFWVVTIVALSMFFKPIDVIDFWFQAHRQAKFTTIARSCSVVCAACFKLFLVYSGGKLLSFAFGNLLQSFSVALLLIIFYSAKSSTTIRAWCFSLSRAKILLRQSWLIFLGTMFAVVYLRIDRVMLKWMVGDEEVGIYAIAATLSEAWYFVPSAIVVSFYPRLIQLREESRQKYEFRLQKLFDTLFVIASVVAICVTVFSDLFIELFFGEQYARSATILSIHIWAAIFIFMRAAFSKWIIIENALIFSLVTQGLGALSNVVLNFYLIPLYGGNGAAVATLIAYASASYFSLIMHTKTRPVFWMMTKSILSPMRYLSGLVN